MESICAAMSFGRPGISVRASSIDSSDGDAEDEEDDDGNRTISINLQF